ncbi:hypothetical protein PCASD_03599 [Puccinia coronata f. sp. avenae]|uniref:Uncharacterized protein n=1 Tax=Puccinia coronata f. sp. avenae TaxID=200324 RepID=A0A2N5VDH5_9BASI|nr:hypothetical protein PCASD_03599 [Puccinia coronata f. sp. avenae]
MSESAKNPTTAPSESTESTHVVPESILQLQGLIYQNFRRLRKKFDPYVLWDPTYPVGSVKTNREAWNEALNKLQFNILPLLRQQINTLPKLLNPSELREDMNGSKLRLMTEIQSELDQSTNHLLSILSVHRHKSDTSPPQADDPDLQEFKQFRCRAVSLQLEYLNHQLYFIFRFCSSSMREFKKPTNVLSHSHQNRRCGIVERTTLVADAMDKVIKCITSHEFILIQENWAKEVSSHDNQITELSQLIHQATNPPEPEANGKPSGQLARSLSKHALPLAQSLIPAIKLSRLFFKNIIELLR